VSLNEALDQQIVTGLSLNALRAASKRQRFPPVVDRLRRGNTGAPEKLYRVSELKVWNRGRT
jgi:hypothetical protein